MVHARAAAARARRAQQSRARHKQRQGGLGRRKRGWGLELLRCALRQEAGLMAVGLLHSRTGAWSQGRQGRGPWRLRCMPQASSSGTMVSVQGFKQMHQSRGGSEQRQTHQPDYDNPTVIIPIVHMDSCRKSRTCIVFVDWDVACACLFG